MGDTVEGGVGRQGENKKHALADTHAHSISGSTANLTLHMHNTSTS